MNFTQLFLKYNYSLNPLHGSVIQCLIKKLQQNMLKRVPITKQARFILGIEDVLFLNSVKGGYDIANVSHITFIPKSFCRNRKVFHSQWIIFSILNMNPKIDNTVVKDIYDGKIDFFSSAKAH
ncbi:hypothetical protein BDL97_14G040200 [Sphagnum fallax]|nr:hypothetical protein BDL97_14G040200 [Sphagnum fallax]